MPKIFYTYSSTEYWARVGSLAYTTVDGAKELPLSTAARALFFCRNAALPLPVSAHQNSARAYENYGNFASAGWSFRALLLDLDDWVTKGTKPPDSAYPHLGPIWSPRDHVEFPKIPGVEFPPYMPRNWRLDYGPDFSSKGIIANEPPKLGATVYRAGSTRRIATETTRRHRLARSGRSARAPSPAGTISSRRCPTWTTWPDSWAVSSHSRHS